MPAPPELPAAPPAILPAQNYPADGHIIRDNEIVRVPTDVVSSSQEVAGTSGGHEAEEEETETLTLDDRRTIDLTLRPSVEPWLPADGYLFRSADGTFKYLKPSGNAVINVMEQLGRRISDTPQGYFHPRPGKLKQQLEPKETRFEGVFDADDGRNVPHHCFMPKGIIRVIKRSYSKTKGYRVVYNNSRHKPASCENDKQVRASISSFAVTPYPLFMFNFNLVGWLYKV